MKVNYYAKKYINKIVTQMMIKKYINNVVTQMMIKNGFEIAKKKSFYDFQFLCRISSSFFVCLKKKTKLNLTENDL